MKKVIAILGLIVLLAGCAEIPGSEPSSNVYNHSTSDFGNLTNSYTNPTVDVNSIDSDFDSNFGSLSENPLIKNNNYIGVHKSRYLTKLNDTENNITNTLSADLNSGNYNIMVIAQKDALKMWENTMFEITSFVKNQSSPVERDLFEKEQSSWVSITEGKAKQQSALHNDGNEETFYYYKIKTDLTKERCYEIVNQYIK